MPYSINSVIHSINSNYKMKKILLAIVALVGAQSVDAQNIRSFKEHLGAPVRIDSLSVVNQTVTVREVGDAAQIVAQANQHSSATVSGYRIMIFMSNSQTARNDALAARDTFAATFPAQRCYITYENPYFKVAVGNYTTQEEALVLLERIKPSFPKAFIIRENIPIMELSE